MSEDLNDARNGWEAAALANNDHESGITAAYRTALTLAHNLCVQISDKYNGDDETDSARAASHCAQAIRGWIEVSNEQILEMMVERVRNEQ